MRDLVEMYVYPERRSGGQRGCILNALSVTLGRKLFKPAVGRKDTHM